MVPDTALVKRIMGRDVLFDRDTPGGDYERLVAFQEPRLGLRGVLVVHSTRLGPAFGGIRRVAYPGEEAMVADACALAHTMSLKCSLAGLDAGGAKMVVQDAPGLDLEEAYRHVGDLVQSLGGAWVCGPDVGTGDRELGWVRERTGFVNPEGNDAAGMTARGVLAGLRGLVRFLDDDPGFGGRSFFVQGLGAVGVRVAHALLDAGAVVQGWDPVPARADAARRLGVQVMDRDSWRSASVDVFVPCALGGVLDVEAAMELQARGVCGSANNPTTGSEAERVLHERGVWLVPDLAVNAGAVAEGVLTMARGASDQVRAEARRLVDSFEATTFRVLQEAASQNVRPGGVAREWAEKRITGS